MCSSEEVIIVFEPDIWVLPCGLRAEEDVVPLTDVVMFHIRPVAYFEAEAEQQIRIEFNFQISHAGMISIHMADCSTGILIGGLKEDLRCMFGDPAHQEWFHRSRKLRDDKTLKSSGIDGRDRSVVQIFVRQTKPDRWQ